jgi:hypothetical protein
MSAEQVAQRLVETGVILPEHAKLLADTLTDYAADVALHWERHEWTAVPSGIRFGESEILLTADVVGVRLLIAAHEATRRRLAIVQSQLDQIRELTEYDA